MGDPDTKCRSKLELDLQLRSIKKEALSKNLVQHRTHTLYMRMEIYGCIHYIEKTI